MGLGTINRIIKTQNLLIGLDANSNKRDRYLNKTYIFDRKLFKWFEDKRRLKYVKSGDIVKNKSVILLYKIQ